MKILAMLLLLTGLTKLCLATISNRMELEELIHNTPVFIDLPPNYLRALITADGLISTLGGIFLLCL